MCRYLVSMDVHVQHLSQSYMGFLGFLFFVMQGLFKFVKTYKKQPNISEIKQCR